LSKIKVYLEIGQKRTFAAALDWPGWCRSGPEEESALQALLDYAPRYARVLRATRLGFKPPSEVSSFVVVERLKGNATTDFGAPGMAPDRDDDPLKPKELAQFEKILKACLRTFETNVKKATGKSLRTGPRGGGRQLESMLEHVLGSDEGYLNQVGWKFKRDNTVDLTQQRKETHDAILSALAASAKGEIPAKGPRGGVRWTARYFARRIAWHTLDHAWELEDRTLVE
jgi:hypothetical protein